MHYKSSDFCLLMTATINPKGMKYLSRSNVNERLDDYKKTFLNIANNYNIKKIIFIENSGHDIDVFRKYAKQYPNKNIEIISSKVNNYFPREYGKGFGEYLCFKEVIKKSVLFKKCKYFIKTTGRYYIKNFNKIYSEITQSNNDIYINLQKNFTYAECSIFGGSKNFIQKYILEEIRKTNDSKNIIFEKGVANATLKAISDGLIPSFSSIPPQIQGFIGTNGKKFRSNIFKNFRNLIFRKFKKYLILSQKY
jgi:hypothetical protein